MTSEETRVYSIKRPHPNLLKYYLTISILLGPFFPFVFLPSYFKYRTLRYTFDPEGVSMSWGRFFHRETRLNYLRLQDIHLASNALERRFGLARVQLQTASGSATPEMTLVGIQEYEPVRDFLYFRMQGRSREHSTETASDGLGKPAPSENGNSTDELLIEVSRGLREVAAELAAVRAGLDRKHDESAS